jgi:hypothetical protein
MITRNDIVRSLTGVWQLFLDKPGAIKLFDASVEGFWNSFQAIVIVAPIYALTVFIDEQVFLASADRATIAQFDAPAYFLSRLVTLGLDWVTLPALLALLAPYLGIRGGYSAYIVIRNWSTVFTLAPYGVVSLLEWTGAVRGAAILIPGGIALAIAVRISYIAARRALAVPVDVAIGFVALDFLVSLGLSDTMTYLFGVAIS